MNQFKFPFACLLSQYIITPHDYQYISQQNPPWSSVRICHWVKQHCYQHTPLNIEGNLAIYHNKRPEKRTLFDQHYFQWLQSLQNRPSVVPRTKTSPSENAVQIVHVDDRLRLLLKVPDNSMPLCQVKKHLHAYIRQHRLQVATQLSLVKVKDSPLAELLPDHDTVPIFQLIDLLLEGHWLSQQN